jgi:hypothetical protein
MSRRSSERCCYATGFLTILHRRRPLQELLELIVRTGSLTKPEALRQGAIAEQKRWLW